jgi:hypothetical protein
MATTQACRFRGRVAWRGTWTAAGQIAAYWPTAAGRRDYTTEATVLLDGQLNAQCRYVRRAGWIRRGAAAHGSSYTPYRFAPSQQIDFHVAAGLSRAAPRNYVGVGYSFLLPVQ